MSDGYGSAAQRTPQEVWWMILDEAIDEPDYFAAAYEGRDWSKYAKMSKLERHGLYKQSERQRKIIGSVCRSWQIFSRSRKSRSIVIIDAEDWEKETTQTARSAFLYDSYVLNSPLAQGVSVEWEILKLRISSVLPKIASTLSSPRIRRLELPLSHKDSLSDTLNIFSNITWLDCDASTWVTRTSTTTNQAPIVLPQLEVLLCECGYFFAPFLSNFVLPSLRYIYIEFDIRRRDTTSTLYMLLPFRQSIQSAVLKGVGNRSDIQNKSIQFPSWNDFPNLKELELETPWTFHFEPLPSDHPLQKLNAQHENFDALPSLVEGSNMRQISLQSTRWTASGELMARIFAVKMDAEKATKLWEIAKARGIRFEVSEIGGAFDDRDKAIAVAATLPTEPLAYLKMLFNQLPR